MPGEQGDPDRPVLESAIWNEPSRLVFVAFDILHLDGRDLAAFPLLRRKEALWQLVEPGLGKIQYSEHFEGSALAIFRSAGRMGLEGIISKRADSRYSSGPSSTWLLSVDYSIRRNRDLSIGTSNVRFGRRP
ncbi:MULTISPECIES: hypothetical protein [unclassified Mesorhizobium]|uniref:ATP-dependent DNA ligase n=1 Tax=unclassified Mesorhizobium TaxID=325217 RepID=UPI001FEDD1CF|nr:MULTISPECIES: hypothetical protein [unclassified Mesorhizobium]